MSTLDSMEDDDDTFYYEVEKIVDMRISETGVHMFLIKWKNYDDAFNTWEPEHNLNCPTILEEFLKGYQKKKTSKTKRKKNSIIKGKKKQHSLPEVEADLQKIVANTKKETAIEKVENKEEKEKDEKEKEEKNKKEKDKKEKDKDEKDKVEKDKVEKDKNEKDVEKDKDKLNENINDTGKGKEKELKRKKSNDDNDDLLEKKRKASTEEVTEQNKRKNVDNPPPKITFTIPSKTKNTSFNTNTSIKLTPKPPSSNVDLTSILKMVGKHSTSSNTPSSPNLSLSKYPPIAPKNISYRAPLNLFSAIPSNHNNLESNHEQKSSLIQYNNLPSHYTTTSTPVKRILPNNRDPRLDPRITTTVESPKRVNFQSTPFLFQGVISKGGKYISSITLEGKQHCYHKEQIQELISTSGKNKEIRNEICISSFLPLKRLNDFIGNRELSFMAISAKDQIVEISKLKSFMQVNEIVGVVSHANKPTEALVILPTSELKKLTNLTAETDLEVKSYNQICAIYLDNLSKRPKIMDEMEYENEDELESSQLFLWNRVASYLRFPTRLKALRPLSQFLVYGQSESSLMLRRALVNEKNQSSIQTNPTNKQYVMMFDRYNGMLFNRSMLKHKKEPTTQIWEFGVHDLSSDEIASACEVFPNNTGGFITTDIENIVNNPDIINTISRQIKKFNEYSIAYGEWKFILPNNFIYHLDQAIRNKKLTEKMQTAIIEVTVALTKNTIQIMKLWPEEQEDMSFIHFMEGILQSYYKNYQHFVYVDDILSVSEDKRKHHLSIDFVQSDQIYNIYK